MFDALAPLIGLSESFVYGAFLVFARIAGVVAMLPGFGERAIPARVRTAAALAFTMLSWPLIYPIMPDLGTETMKILPLFLSEVLIGLLLGLAVRLLIMALQLAGSIAAQATSVAQIMGAGATPDPMPALGNILLLGGLALALAADVHLKAIAMIRYSYEVLPLGAIPLATDLTPWGVAQAAGAFKLAFSLAAPFVLAALAYYIALGFISRAMPQLMVALIGAPAITMGAIAILLLTSPILLTTWSLQLDRVLANPFGTPP